jgi:hypothetical protein
VCRERREVLSRPAATELRELLLLAASLSLSFGGLCLSTIKRGRGIQDLLLLLLLLLLPYRKYKRRKKKN